MTHPRRRDLLQLAAGSALWSLAGAPSLAATPLGAAARGAGDRRLILLFLAGGNDGLNSVVPFEDDAYHRARPRLGLDRHAVARLDGLTGLHPSLEPWRRTFDDGRLAILRGVGPARPDRSHFVSRDLWECGAERRPATLRGWVGRALDHADPAALPAVALGAQEAVLALRGARHDGLTLSDPERLTLAAEGRAALAAAAGAPAGVGAAGAGSPLAERLGRVARDTYALSERLAGLLERVPSRARYPDTRLGDQLALAVRLVRAEGGPPVVFCEHGGFDTHAVQLGTHASLLAQLAQATTAAVTDLAADGSDRRTLLLIYSEFGRRVAENGSAGTDHGAAAPVFALGGALRAGLHGPPPDLGALKDGDVAPRVSHRAVLADAARWMGWDVPALFGDDLAPTGLLG